MLVLVLLVPSILPALPARADLLPDPLPSQVHLALTGDPTQMVVMWATSLTGENTLEYGRSADDLDQIAQGTVSYYEWTLLLHTVKLTGLLPQTTYYYHVGEPSRWSQTFQFQTPPSDPSEVTLGAVADQGTTDEAEQVTARMAAAGLDLVVFPGDLSYANGLQPLWDDWGDQVQAVAARTPYMFAPGNHEKEPGYDFDAYLTRFYTPYLESGSASPFYYSFNFSTIHFISISTEHEYGLGSTQYRWLERDLAAATADRATHPWVILYGHRPMYSSNAFHGSEMALRSALEELIYTYQVDLTLAGHDHSFERTYPVYQGRPLDTGPGTVEEPYLNPEGPLHVVVGTGGGNIYDDLTGQHDFVEPQPAWSAYREASYGYSRFTVTPEGTLRFQYLRAADNTVAHEFWIKKVEEAPEAPPLAFIDSLTPSPVAVGLNVTFSGHGEAANGSIAAYRWTSSLDGELSQQANFTTAALSPGHHSLTFQVADDQGVWSEPAAAPLWVYAPPVALAGPDVRVRLGEQVKLVGSGNDADGSIARYQWDFDGDGSFDWSSDKSGLASTVYRAEGVYTARLQVTDSDNFTASDTLTVTVLPAGSEGARETPSLSFTTALLALVLLAHAGRRRGRFG